MTDLTTIVSSLTGPSAGLAQTSLLAGAAEAPSTGRPAPAGFDSVGQAFEASVLQPMLAAMLPPEDSAAWGGGTGSSAWRGLFAEAVAAELARGGGIGIAGPVDAALADRADTLTTDNR